MGPEKLTERGAAFATPAASARAEPPRTCRRQKRMVAVGYECAAALRHV